MYILLLFKVLYINNKMKFKCEYCNKEYDQKFLFNRHQKSSKQCLLIRSGTIKNGNFDCTFCNKLLSSKQSLENHQKICKKRDDEKDKIKKISKEMEIVKKELKQLKDSKTVNNITITNNLDQSINNYCSLVNYMKPEVIEESFKEFTIDKMLKGTQKDLADITIKNLLSGKDQPLYICTDRSRNKFVYTDEENKEKEDANATVLRTLIYNGIAPLLKKMYHEEYIKLNNELARCKRTDNTETITISREDIKNLDKAYKDFNIIKKPEDYISHLSKCLPTSIKDRIYRDDLEEKIALEKSEKTDSDEEFEKQLQMIEDYTISELQSHKAFYKKTGIMKGPKYLLESEKYKAFLNE